MTHIVVISGSNRAQAQSHRVAQIVMDRLSAQGGAGDTQDLFSLSEIDIPLWDESKWSPDKPADSFWATTWPGLSQRLAAADGFVVIAPEWHGMAPPHLKNLIICADGKEMAFKPAYPVAVSASVGGAYPIPELRMNSGKNTMILWQPDHLIIRQVNDFKPGAPDNASPDWLLDRLDHGLEILRATAQAMKPVRENVVKLDLLKTGM